MTTRVGLYRDGRNKARPWVVRWFGEYDPAKGKQRHYSKAFTRRRDAEAFQSARQAELDRGGTRDRPPDISVREFTERYLESRLKNRRPATRHSYHTSLTQLSEFVGPETPVRRISRELAERFIATRQRVSNNGKGFSDWSRKCHLINAKAAFNVLVEWGYLSENPFRYVKLRRCVPRKWHHLTPAQFRSLLEAVKDLRWRAFYLLAYTTGARFGELFNLTWADIDFDHQTVTISHRTGSATTPPFQVKDHEARTMLLPGQTVKALLAYQANAPDGVPYVLLTADRWRRVIARWQQCKAREPWKQNKKTGEMEWAEWENRYMVNNVLRDMRSHLRWAGIKTAVPFTIHTLRKSFGQNHASSGTPMHVLQRLMGHADITTTREFYLQIADANEREALARYETLLGKQNGGATCVSLAYGGVSRGTRQKHTSVTPADSAT